MQTQPSEQTQPVLPSQQTIYNPLLNESITISQTKPHTPPHLREETFRKYEAHIATILRNWPRPTTCYPKIVSPTTFIARIRDAINSVIEYKWKTPIDVNLLEQIWATDNKLFFYTQTNTNAVIASKRMAKSENIAATLTSDFDENKFSLVLTEEKATATALLAVAYLLENKILKKPAKLIKPDQRILHQIMGNYDVGVALDPDEAPETRIYIMV